MGAFKKFEEIGAWQKARVLTQKIYEVTRTGSFSQDFSLKDQIRRASVSIMSNIAEGFDRGGKKEFSRFLAIAKSSGAEVKSQLYVALDQEYISQELFEDLMKVADETNRMIYGLIAYLRSPRNVQSS